MLELRVTCRIYTCIIYSVIYTHGSLQVVIYSNGRGVSSRAYRHISSKALVWRIALSPYYLCRQFRPKSTVLVIPLALVLLYLSRQFRPKSTVLVISLASILLWLCRQFRPKSTVLVNPLSLSLSLSLFLSFYLYDSSDTRRLLKLNKLLLQRTLFHSVSTNSRLR